MEKMDSELLRDIHASGTAYATTSPTIRMPEAAFHNEVKRHSDFETSMKGNYLFTLDNWDVVELDGEAAVRTFANELDHQSIRLPDAKQRSFEANPPILRYIMAYRVLPDEEAMALMDLPITDRYVVGAFLLANGDEYVPIGAQYVGETPSEQEKTETVQLLKKIGRAITNELDKTTISPAPRLDNETKEVIRQFARSTKEMPHQDKNNLVQELMRLGDLEFTEAVSRMLVYAWDREREWFPTQPDIANRMYQIKQAHSDWHSRMKTGAWKTAWMLPQPFEPKMVSLHRTNRDHRTKMDVLE